ncbi:MAG: hypothetical protein GY762_15945 [Proteobacteria bacterium]|nr:hypothetical protein [Pseudomonadota bacterium]
MSSDKYVGQVLDNKYQILELLGKGGMGAVYKGRHVVIGKTVAVKFLHQEFAKNKEVVQRFYREAQAAVAIGHGSIIDVMDVGISPDNEPKRCVSRSGYFLHQLRGSRCPCHIDRRLGESGPWAHKNEKDQAAPRGGQGEGSQYSFCWILPTRR